MPVAYSHHNTTTTTTVLRPFLRNHLGEPVPEENFWTLWCKGRFNTDRHTDHPARRHSIQTNQCPPPASPHIFRGRMSFLPPNQQRQSTEGNQYHIHMLNHTIFTVHLIIQNTCDIRLLIVGAVIIISVLLVVVPWYCNGLFQSCNPANKHHGYVTNNNSDANALDYTQYLPLF